MRMCQNEPNPESQIKDFRGFSSFRELGNAANGIFYSSQYWKSRFSFIVPLRKPPFPVFRSLYPYESLFLPIFVHCIPTKASFSQFSFIVSLRKLLFANFRSLYPYESLFFPFFINCTPYLSDFSRKLMIYARV